jgi:hypothetical protein
MKMNPYWGFVGAMLLFAACGGVVDTTGLETDDQDATQAGSGGAGGKTNGDCVDRWGSGGAVHFDPIVPPVGSWCPQEGFELCTSQGTSALASTAVARPFDVAVVLSRCVAQHWQTIPGAICGPTTPHASSAQECNVFTHLDPDGVCCVDVRNCERAFCDGERWWTRR